MQNFKDRTLLDPRQISFPFNGEAFGSVVTADPEPVFPPATATALASTALAATAVAKTSTTAKQVTEIKKTSTTESVGVFKKAASLNRGRVLSEQDLSFSLQPVVRNYQQSARPNPVRFRYQDLTIILPTLNEVENIAPMLDELADKYPGVSIVVVDDGSDDGTPDEVRIRTDRYREKRGVLISLVERNDRVVRGITASVLEGLEMVKTEYMVLMDADFQHPLSAVQLIFDELENGADVAVGCRDAGKGLFYRRGPTLWSGEVGSLSFSRTLASWAATKLARTTLVKSGIEVRDPLSGLFGIKTDLFRALVGRSKDEFEEGGYKVLYDVLRLLPRLGSHGSATEIREVVYKFCQRQGGESKLKAAHGICFLRAVLAEKFNFRN